MTRTASRRIYASWDSGHAYNTVNGSQTWGSVDVHLPIGFNDSFVNNNQPVLYFPIDLSGIESLISSQMVVTVLGGTHFSLKSANPMVRAGLINTWAPDHQNRATVCGGGGWAAGAGVDPILWGPFTQWPSHNPYWAYGIDVSNLIQAIRDGWPAYGFILNCDNGVEWARTEIGANDSGYTAFIDINYNVPNEAPYQGYISSPGNGSGGNNPSPLVRGLSSGDVDGDPGATALLQYGVVDAYGIESWQTQIGAAGFDGNPAQYIGDFYPSLTRGKWHCFRCVFQDHHGAYSPWSGPSWHYVNANPNNPTVTGGMQPIHNLGALATWSGPEAQPQIQVYVSDPDGDAITRVEIQLSADQSAIAYHGAFEGSWGSGTYPTFNVPYGLPNDVTWYARAIVRDSQGNF